MIDVFFFFNDTATTEIYTLSLHDALPIYDLPDIQCRYERLKREVNSLEYNKQQSHTALSYFNNQIEMKCKTLDRKSTRLNSSHANISYAVFCLKKKKQNSSTTLALH